MRHFYRVILVMALVWMLASPAWADERMKVTADLPVEPIREVARAAFRQGVAAFQAEDYATAHMAFTAAIQSDAAFAAAYGDRCLTHIYLEHYAEAVADCSQALELNPNNPEVYLNHAILADIYDDRGLAQLQLQNYRGAIADFTQAMQLNPADLRAYFNRGCTHHREGNYAAALTDFDQVL
jgi:tetratricopeptide (TPR) repeat protein